MSTIIAHFTSLAYELARAILEGVDNVEKRMLKVSKSSAMAMIQDWPTIVAEAKPLQESLARQVLIIPLERQVKTIAGIDAAFVGQEIIAAVAVFDYASLTLIEESHARLAIPFPYVPGYLSFREGPAFIAAIERLSCRPDLFIVDGQGIAHPRGVGIASFLGVLLQCPTIGSAKSRLVGETRSRHRPAGRGLRWSTTTILWGCAAHQ